MPAVREPYEKVLESWGKIKEFLFASDDLSDTQKENLRTLIEHLENDTEFLTAYCSTHYHCSYEGGLLEHTIHVCNTIMRVKRVLAPEYSDAQVVLVALFHDIGKYCQYARKEPTEKQKKYGYPGSMGINTQCAYMNHEDRSLWFVSQYYQLSEEEYAAIAFHNYLFRSDDSAYFNCSKLAWLLAIADGWACTFLDEPGAY